MTGTSYFININDRPIEVKIAKSPGRNIRMTYKDGKGRISIPRGTSQAAMEGAVTSMNKWLNELSLKKPHLFKHALSGALEGNQIKILDREYELIILANRTGTTIRGKKNSNQLIFDIPQSIMNDTEAKQKYIPSVISKMFAAEMEERIHSINGRTIQGKLGNVTLRSASSRWGSCTGRNDIMISNRLLLAPNNILDHVIIHELAHIVHKDHSIRFWRLVAAHDDSMKAHHNWLKVHGSTLLY